MLKKNFKPVVIIIGPTAVGKTLVAHRLAKNLNNAEIISADSRKIYKFMDIGTAKPNLSLRKEIVYHLINIKYPDENYNVAEFKLAAEKIIDELHNKNKIPIMVGGTGLYVRAITKGLFLYDSTDLNLRTLLYNELSTYGKEYIYEKLKEVDMATANKLHINDTKRIIRALEVFYKTGSNITYLQQKYTKKKEYDFLIIYLYLEREKLYEKINKRVEKMFKLGFIEEVKQLMLMGYHRNLRSMEALGYRRIMDYLESRYSSVQELIEQVKTDSRHFAKRQNTWFKQEEQKYSFLPYEFDKIYDFVNKWLEKSR